MLVRHSAAYLLARGLPGLVTFLSLAVYTRLLSPEEYGLYAVVFSGVNLCNAVLFQWLRLGVLRFLPVYGGRKQEFLSAIAAGYIVLVGITAVLGGGLILRFSDDRRGLYLLGLGLLWVQAWFDVSLELSRSELSPGRYGVMSGLRAVVALVIGVLCVLAGWGGTGIIIGLLVGAVVPSVWALFRDWRGVRPYIEDTGMMTQVLRYGLPLTVSFAMDFVISSSSRFWLLWFQGADEAGLYSVGYDIAQQTLGLLMMIVNLAAFPLAVRAFESGGNEGARKQLSQNLVILLSVSLPACVGLGLLAPSVATVFLGESFVTTGARIIPWVSLAALLLGLKAFYFDMTFQLTRTTTGQVAAVVAAALVNTVLNILLIPKYGLMGAIHATVAAYGTGLALSWFFGRRLLPLPFPHGDVLRVVLASATMGGFLLLQRPSTGIIALASRVAMGVVIYGGAYLALNVADSQRFIRGRLRQWRTYR